MLSVANLINSKFFNPSSKEQRCLFLQDIKSNKHFTLKNLDKRVSTLKSLAPKKTGQGTIRKKDTSKTNDSDSEEDDEN